MISDFFCKRTDYVTMITSSFYENPNRKERKIQAKIQHKGKLLL